MRGATDAGSTTDSEAITSNKVRGLIRRTCSLGEMVSKCSNNFGRLSRGARAMRTNTVVTRPVQQSHHASSLQPKLNRPDVLVAGVVVLVQFEKMIGMIYPRFDPASVLMLAKD